MDTQKIKALIIGVLATFAALYLGISAATAQFETIAWVIGGLTLTICLFLGRRIWLILPFMQALSIQLRVPGQPNTLLIAELLILGFGTLLFLMRRLPYRFAMTELECWIILITLFVVQVYIRNPTGLNLFGGNTVGGKPYALLMIHLATALILTGLVAQEHDLKWILRLSILGGLANLGVATLGRLFPVVGFYTGATFDRTDQTNYEGFGNTVDEKAATRIGSLTEFGISASLWISVFISPLRAIFKPFWAVLILTVIIAAMLGGYRNGIAIVGLNLICGIAYRSGAGGVFISAVAGAAGIAVIALVNMLYPLPPNLQRSMSFLPGTWEQRYIDDAAGSTEWRVEIWKEALLTNRWIKNKWLGDGLGFSATELAAQMNYRQGSRAGISGFEAHRESVLANGDYHSGPVSVIRTIGYVGLFFLVIAQIRLAMRAHRQIVRCKGTPWFPLALFVGIPLIWNPFFFVCVFGAFDTAIATFFLGIGMVRLLENNLPLPAYGKRGLVQTPPVSALGARPQGALAFGRAGH